MSLHFLFARERTRARTVPTRAGRAALLAAAALCNGCTFRSPSFDQPLACGCDAPDHAYVYCDYARCRFGGCQPGFFNVDGDPINGCEVDQEHLAGNLQSPLVGEIEWTVPALGYGYDVSYNFISSVLAIDTPNAGCFEGCRNPGEPVCDDRYRVTGFQIALEPLGFFAVAGGEVRDAIIEGAPAPSAPDGAETFIDGSHLLITMTAVDQRIELTNMSGGLSVRPFSDRSGFAAIEVFGFIDGDIGNSPVEIFVDVFGFVRMSCDGGLPVDGASPPEDGLDGARLDGARLDGGVDDADHAGDGAADADTGLDDGAATGLSAPRNTQSRPSG